MDLLKAGKGIQPGDVANAAVRNLLGNIGGAFFSLFTEQDQKEAIEFFEGKCPYTGEVLTEGNMALDHIIPQNKEHCGFNTPGNLVVVSKKANQAKSFYPFEIFLDSDRKIWEEKNIDFNTRQISKGKIKEFMKKHPPKSVDGDNYDIQKITEIAKVKSQLLYEEIKKLLADYARATFEEIIKLHHPEYDNAQISETVDIKVKQVRTNRDRVVDMVNLLRKCEISDDKTIEALLGIKKITKKLICKAENVTKTGYYSEPMEINGGIYYISNQRVEEKMDKLKTYFSKDIQDLELKKSIEEI